MQNTCDILITNANLVIPKDWHHKNKIFLLKIKKSKQ